jgi:hypothetical protein
VATGRPAPGSLTTLEPSARQSAGPGVLGGGGAELGETRARSLFRVDSRPAAAGFAAGHPHDIAPPGWERLGVPGLGEGLVPGDDVEPGTDDARRCRQHQSSSRSSRGMLRLVGGGWRPTSAGWRLSPSPEVGGDVRPGGLRLGPALGDEVLVPAQPGFWPDGQVCESSAGEQSCEPHPYSSIRRLQRWPVDAASKDCHLVAQARRPRWRHPPEEAARRDG